MRAVLDRSAEIVAWAARQITLMHGRPFPEPASAIGVENARGEIVGAVVFHDHHPYYRTIQVSAVSIDPRWMQARDAFREMFRYCFEVCGVDKIYSLTPRSNERALRFVWGLGFKAEAILTRQFGDEDAVLSSCFRWDYY